MGNIKAIETVYKGYRFRSRLEARWAVFFDALGVKWVYEPEGYDLGDAGWYLPDFWLPQVKSFAEVKPKKFTHEEFYKCVELPSACILLDSEVPENRPYFEVEKSKEDDYLLLTDGGASLSGWYYAYEKFLDNFWQGHSCVCLTMYHNYPADEGRFYSSPGGKDDGEYEDTARACIAARSARFEHDERKATT